ncbi:Guanylate-binding protein [Aureococcus anophagefferens]|nr:Guanylate-binding protein [Aureococcus anophagefferens]
MDPDALDVVPLITQCDELGADGESLLRVDDAGVALLEALGGEKVSVVAVAGMYRTGKSFFLNRLAGAAGARSGGFGVGETTEPCTRGVWLWRSPGLRAADGSTLLLMDTEGLASADQDDSYDAKIFALALLLSSYFVLNVVGVIDDATIERLHLVSEVTKRVVVEGEPTVDDEDEAAVLDRSAAALAAHFPPLLVLVRDFALKPTRDGQPITDAEGAWDAAAREVNARAADDAEKCYDDHVASKNPPDDDDAPARGLPEVDDPAHGAVEDRFAVYEVHKDGAKKAMAVFDGAACDGPDRPARRKKLRVALDRAGKRFRESLNARSDACCAALCAEAAAPTRVVASADDAAALARAWGDHAQALDRACRGPRRLRHRGRARWLIQGSRSPRSLIAEARGAAELADATARVEADRDAKADVAAKDDALGVLRRELRDAAAAAESGGIARRARPGGADAELARAEDDASAAALRHGDALERRDEALAAAAAGAREAALTPRSARRRQGGARGEEDEDDGEDRGRTAPRNASQPRSRSVGPMAAPDEPEAESTDDREAYKSSGVSTARRDLDQIPRSQRLQKRQKSPIGLSLVQLEEIGLLDYDEDERPRSDDAPDAAPESAAPAAPEPPQADDAPPTSVSAPASPKRHASGSSDDAADESAASPRDMDRRSRTVRLETRSREPADAPGKQRTNGHRSSKASSSFVAQDKRRARPRSAVPRERGKAGPRPQSAYPRVLRPEGWAAPAKALGAAGPSSDLDDIVEHDDDDGELDAFEGPHETLEPATATRRASGPGIFAHFDRRVRKCFDARDLLEGLVDLGVGATLGDARALVRRFCRDAPDDASQLAVHLGDFAVFVDDPDHDAFERDVCEAVAKRRPPRVLRAAFGDEPRVSRRAFARGLRAVGLEALSDGDVRRLVARFDTEHDGRCAARFAKMVRRSPEWRENAWLRRVRLAAAREADVACDAARRCGGRWANGLDEALVEACRTLGLRVFTDADLAWIALDALEAPLPTG